MPALVRLRVVTYNIHKCIGGVDRRYRPDRVLETIGHYQPDVVLLQEVDSQARRSLFHHQVDMIGEEIGYRHRTWFPNVRLRGGGNYGNAIITRHTLTSTENIDVTQLLRKPRSVLHARLRVRFGHRRRTRTIHVFNMHLGLSQYERRRQLKKFLASHPFAGLHERTPIIVAGDFNDLWGNLGRELLEPVGFRSAPTRLATFPAWGPVRPLDAIYVRGDLGITRMFRSQLEVARQASDHLPLVADLVVSP